MSSRRGTPRKTPRSRATPRTGSSSRRGTPRSSRRGTPRASGTPRSPSTRHETPRRPRRRSALKNYYGIGNDDKDEHQDPTDMDSSSFEVEPYFDSLLRDQHMKRLVKERFALQNSIKRLDNDMKTLVYENYNKFISATDTIRVMKSNVDNMKEEMSKLEENINDIRTSTETINESLSPAHHKVAELGGIYKLLKKTQFLTSLPQRLSQALEMKAYNQAVHDYTTNLWILKEYSHLTSFNTILNECNAVMETLKTVLQSSLDEDEIPLREMANNIKLLLSLNGSAEEMMSDYVARQGSKVLRLTADLLEKCSEIEKGVVDVPLMEMSKDDDDDGVDDDEKDNDVDDDEKDNNVNDDEKDDNDDDDEKDEDVDDEKDDDEVDVVADQAMDSTTSKSSSSPPWLQLLESGLAQLRSSFLSFLQSFRDCFVYNIDLDRALRKSAQETFDNFSGDFFTRYSELCCRLLARCTDPSHLLVGLAAVNEEVELLTKAMPDLLSVVDFGSEITTRAIQRHIDETYERLERSVVDRLKELIEAPTDAGEAELSQYVRGFVEHPNDRGDTGPDSRSKFTAAAIVKDAMLFFNGVEPLLSEQTSPALAFLEGYSSMCYTQVTVRTQKCVLCIVESLNEVFDELKTTEAALSVRAAQRPCCLLELARLALHFRVWAIDRLDYAVNHLGEVSHCLEMAGINPPALKESFFCSSEGLLSYYVKLNAQRLSALVERCLSEPKWRTYPEPTEVSEEAVAVVDTMVELRKQVCGVFEPISQRRLSIDGNHSGSHRTRPGSARTRKTPRASGLNSFSFDTAITIFGGVSADSPSIITCIVRALLKCYLECVRMQTFNVHGYQQMQVDMHYIGIALRKFMSDERLFERMRRDVLASAKDRTLHDSPELPSKDVSALCEPLLQSPRL